MKGDCKVGLLLALSIYHTDKQVLVHGSSPLTSRALVPLQCN